MLIIVTTYAIVEPKTMVVELFDAFITSSTMLATIIDIHLTYLTIEFILAFILKTLIHPNAFLLNLYQTVFWVYFCGSYSVN